jgi:hypothetical protein
MNTGDKKIRTSIGIDFSVDVLRDLYREAVR